MLSNIYESLSPCSPFFTLPLTKSSTPSLFRNSFFQNSSETSEKRDHKLQGISGMRGASKRIITARLEMKTGKSGQRINHSFNRTSFFTSILSFIRFVDKYHP